ncbi:sporulation protein YqfD [Calditerricola satsumensis]|uniref:Sporulation protein YqfD n=3 Tax=Calditerricola satsumensis TaxID=373054 RepID=A0A8J3B9E6_9BACI|nr:sporulation protein YqfD [Calditerricola satsumensis]GGK05087.1 sporulation protein YqfD [Calditerricola satsumensis]
MRDRWLKWWLGYVVLAIRGRYLERFLNQIVRQGVFVWDVRITGERQARLAVLVRDVRRLRSARRPLGIRARIVAKRGWPFWRYRLARRKGFVTGLLFFVVLLYGLSQMVWHVEVVGNERLRDEEVRRVAEELGIKRGQWRAHMKELDELQRQLLSRLPDVAWVGIEMKGTRVRITVVEQVKPEEKPAQGPSHLVAAKRGMVHRLIVERGRPLVRPNEWVAPGQVLVSGVMGDEGQTRIVGAEGKVEAEVWYESEVAVPLVQKREVLTGRRFARTYALVGTYRIRLRGYEAVPFARYRVVEEREEGALFGRRLPLGWRKEVFLETELQEVRVSPTEAAAIGKRLARADVLRRIGDEGRILREKVLHSVVRNDTLYMKLHVVTLENIARAQPIPEQGD